MILIAIYAYFATLKQADTADVTAHYTVEAIPFLREFDTDHATANSKYTEKIIQVNGIVSATEQADSTINIKMIDSTTGSYIIFAFQEEHLHEASALNAGDIATIKGSCSGGVHSSILDANFVSFKRSALVQ